MKAILCVSENWCIGKDNDLLFSIKEDMEFFKLITTGHKVLMGRKTFESLPNKLPFRYHLVLSRDEKFKLQEDFPGRKINIDELEDYKKNLNNDETIFVIGGAEVYNYFIGSFDEIFITKVHEVVEGDAFVKPEILDGMYRVFYTAEKTNGKYKYHFEKWRKRK